MNMIVGDILSCEFSVIVLTSISGGGCFSGSKQAVLHKLWPAMNGKLKLGDFLPKRLPDGRMIYAFVCLDEREDWPQVPEIIRHCLANSGLVKPSVYALDIHLSFPTEEEISIIYNLFENYTDPYLRFGLLLSEEEAKRAKELQA